MIKLTQSLPAILGCTAIIALSGCSSPTKDAAPNGKLQVVATTTIVGDVVKQIAGEEIDLTVLLPYNADPHSYEPTPQDTALIAQADLVFVNGLGLEGFLEALVTNAGKGATVYTVSEGLEAKHFEGAEKDHAGESASTTEHADHEDGDPHVWTDPNNVQHWVANITSALSRHDPEHAAHYQQRATAYSAELTALDQWIRQQIDSIPPERRQIITDHQSFGYFAERYGLVQVAALIPGYSTASAPSAQELAAIVDTIETLGVPAIFVGKTVNTALAERIVEDTGTRMVYVYTGSLGEAGGEAGSYLDYMHYNVNAFTEALR